MNNNKKAIGPIITTLLLILLALTLASIIFLWARGFIGEQVSKFDKPIADSCVDIKISPTLSENSITILNGGNIAIYQLGIRVTIPDGSSTITIKDVRLVPTGTIVIDAPEISEGSRIDLIPILLGTSSNGGSVEFQCLSNVFPVE